MKRLKKITILISHIPNPRILKRIKALEKDFKINLIYWDRGHQGKESFDINPMHKIDRISIDAPRGQPVKRIAPLVKYTFRALKLLINTKPDIVHAANFDMLFIANVYRVISRRNIKIFYEVADLPKYTFYNNVNSIKSLIARLLQIIEKRMTNNISKLILTSPYFWEKYFSKFVDSDKYLFIPNAPYKELFNNYNKVTNENFTIGFIGSVRYVEQLKMLIDVVDEIKDDIQVLIAGGGPGYEEILKFSEGKEFVLIYGPYNYEKEIVDLYGKLDCTYSVYDTRIDNVRIALPNRLYESIVCEIPIIGAKNTVLGQFIEDNKIGVTVNSSDKEELKTKLIDLINTKEILNSYKESCKKIKEDYYYENNVNKLVREYKKL